MFVLLSTQRSGSTWMIDMLNSHPKVVAYSELFIGGGRGFPKWGGARDIPFWETYRDAHASEAEELLLERYLKLVSGKQHEQVAGFKLMYEQESAYPGILRYLTAHGGSMLHLVRRNVLDVLISRETAAARDLYHARQSHKLSPCRIRLDAATLIDRLTEQSSQIEKARTRYNNMKPPLLEVCYEELCTDRDCFSKVLSFLGVDPFVGKLNTSLKKINSEAHHDLVENYDEVSETLCETAFECFLR